MRKPFVIYKAKDGKRRQKSVRVSVFADVNEVVREFTKQNRFSPYTYVYRVFISPTTYIWNGNAIEAFTAEQVKQLPY